MSNNFSFQHFTYNNDFNEREQILFGDKYDEAVYAKHGQIRQFKDVPVGTIAELVEKKHADPDDAQNNAPSIKELLDYAKEHKDTTFDGYAVGATRQDYRISIDTVNQKFNSKRDISDFINAFGNADELQTDEDYGRAWWD